MNFILKYTIQFIVFVLLYQCTPVYVLLNPAETNEDSTSLLLLALIPTSTTDSNDSEIINAPQNVSVSGLNQENNLQWLTVSNATFYAIFWDTNPNITTNSNRINSITSNTFIHTGRTNGVTYYYRIMAISGNGTESILSSEVNTTTAAGGLFFSKYIEGSGTRNKALEIFNNTADGIDLSNCILKRYSNGNVVALNHVLPAINLASKAKFIVCNHVDIQLLAGWPIAESCDHSTGFVQHTGNDTWELNCNGTSKDFFGQVGFDPGTEWRTDGVGTKDQTLHRKCGVVTGDTDGSNVFDPSQEWTQFNQNYVDDMGSHPTCGS